MIKLDIISDPICPWCYVGKSYLDRALHTAPDHPFTLEWHPFQLNPDMPREGMDRSAYLIAKFGGRDQAVKVYAQVEEAAKNAGLDIDFGAISRVPNTLDAHRIIYWAGLEGHQNAVVDAIFRAYWHEKRDIGQHETLADIAQENNMDRAATLRLLTGDADRADISARDAHARERGVSGVPFFIVAEQHALSGAQTPALWASVIEELTQTPPDASQH